MGDRLEVPARRRCKMKPGDQSGPGCCPFNPRLQPPVGCPPVWRIHGKIRCKDNVTLKQFANSIGMRMVPNKAGFSRASELCADRPGCRDAQTVLGRTGSPRLPVPGTHRRPDRFRCGGRESKFLQESLTKPVANARLH